MIIYQQIQNTFCNVLFLIRFYQYQASVVNEQKSTLHFELDELLKLVHLLSNRKDIKIEFKALLSQILADVLLFP